MARTFRQSPEPPAQKIQAALGDEQQNELDVRDQCITRQEIKAALKNMKNGEAAGMDTITTELLRAGKETTACILQYLFRTVWEV